MADPAETNDWYKSDDFSTLIPPLPFDPEASFRDNLIDMKRDVIEKVDGFTDVIELAAESAEWREQSIMRMLSSPHFGNATDVYIAAKKRGITVGIFDTSDLAVTDTDRIGISPYNDIIRPVCNAGVSRSPTLKVVLEQLKRFMPNDATTRIWPQHGAESGCDPWTRYTDITLDNFYQYLYSTPDEETFSRRIAFERAFGTGPGPRFGDTIANAPMLERLNVEREADIPVTETMRQIMHDYFTRKYYTIPPQDNHAGKRHIFLCFSRGFGIVLTRLLEANPDVDLSHVIVMGFADGDPSSNAGTPSQVAKARTLYPDATQDMDDEELRIVLETACYIRLFHRFADRFYIKN